MNWIVRSRMKISKIEYENFRNFRDRGEIRFSTDGKVSIIYGKNGDGKTTLHQLFQWIIYGKVHFNKTTTDRLYNLQYENSCSFGDTFQVFGCIDFEHAGSQYSLRRTFTYKKGLNDSEKIAEDLSLNKMDNDHNWKRVEQPKDVIEKLLPSGLADYFFFDGESMIADLRVKGRDSATKLRKALYSMFDLDLLESAINHIGRTDLKTTVLGKLYLGKATISSGSQISAVKTNIENAQNKLESFDKGITQKEAEQQKKQEFLVAKSEQIGSQKSKKDYEARRKEYKSQRDLFIKNASNAQSYFGDAVMDMFPHLLISEAVKRAKEKIHLKISDNKLPSGLNKKLISHLLSEHTDKCVCGRSLSTEERNYIQEFLKMLPPRSYTNLYNDFSNTARSWGKGFDPSKIEDCILSVIANNEQAAECDQKIHDLDEDEKKSPDIEELIVQRQEAEADLKQLEETLQKYKTERKKYEIYLNKQMQIFDTITRQNATASIALEKIEIMEQVAAYFKSLLDQES